MYPLSFHCQWRQITNSVTIEKKKKMEFTIYRKKKEMEKSITIIKRHQHLQPPARTY